MNLDHETLELLMGKHLDGEISGAEARLLQTHLEKDMPARQLLDQLQDLHRSSQEAMTEAILNRGRSAQDIIDAALQQSPGYRPLRAFRKVVLSQFSAGLAAGLLIAAACFLSFIKPVGQQQPTIMAQPEADDGSARDTAPRPRFAEWPKRNNRIQRNVDWIVFTDEQGQHYLVEGLREDRRVRPAVYQRDF